MKYNVIKNGLITVNGNITLTEDQMSAILEISDTAVETLTANSGTGIYDKLIIECDFGVRLHSGEMRYYFDGDVSNTAVVSGISFQYKNETFQDYTSLPVYVNQNYYNTNVSGIMFAPRYIKFTHDLEQTEGFLTTLSGYVEGSIRGLELYNDDTYVDFGFDGTAVGDTISIAREATADIREVSIYNSGPFKSTAYVSLDPTYTNLDEVMAVSNTNSGPWVYPRDENLVIMRTSENADYGIYNDVVLINEAIKLVDEYLDGYGNLAFQDVIESGDYTTKIFFNDNTTWNSIIVDRAIPLEGFLCVDSNDGVETIQVKSSNYKPKSYSFYREFYDYREAGVCYLRYKDVWTATGQIKTTSTVNILSNSSSNFEMWKDFFIVIDHETEKWAGFAYVAATTDTDTKLRWYLLNIDVDMNIKSKIMVEKTTTSLSFDWRHVNLDFTGGMWIYFCAISYGTSTFVSEPGYYLCYFDTNLNEKFKYIGETDFLGVMDVHYNYKHLWYTLPNSGEIRKLDFDGTVLYNHFENTENLGGLCVLSNGCVWYCNAKSLYKLNSNGSMINSETLTDVADNKFVFIAPDGDGLEALWVLENFYVSRLIIFGENKGRKDFSVYINAATRLYPINDGVWVWCNNGHMYYVSKDNKCVDREYSSNYISACGVLEYTYEDQFYTNKLPISIDQNWSSLEWKKVNTEVFILPEDNYHQIKITLRRQSPYQRYGDDVNFDAVFHTDDDFNQLEESPDNVVWGDYQGNGRVYVESNQLVMTKDVLVIHDSYINTKDRYVLTGDFDVQFDYVMGDGTQTNKDENIYLYGYVTDTGSLGQYIMSRIYIPSSMSSVSYIYIYVNGNYSSISLGANYNRWTGKLRLKRSGDSVYGYVWDPQTNSWKGYFYSGVNALGDYFYLQITTSKEGSNVYIDNWAVTAGTVYYYTETPKVRGIYICKEVEVKDIYPNTSKSVYLKSYVSQELDLEDHYDTTLKVRWKTPIN